MNESLVLNVTGMKCGGCETNVKTKLEALDGVVSVSASSKEKLVSVEFDSEKVSITTLHEAIKNAGFTVESN